MGAVPREMASKVSKSRVAGGGQYLNHGDYLLMITKWDYQHVQDRCIILEFRVLESKKKVVYEGKTRKEEEPNEVGSIASAVANFDGKGKQSADSNSKAPVLALLGLKDVPANDERVADELHRFTQDDQPARGMVLRCSTFPKEKRSAPGEFITGLNWECVDPPGQGENAPDKVAARLARWDHEGAGTPAAASGNGHGTAPAIPTPPAPPASPHDRFKAAGWAQHPDDPRFWWRGTEVVIEEELAKRATA